MTESKSRKKKMRAQIRKDVDLLRTIILNDFDVDIMDDTCVRSTLYYRNIAINILREKKEYSLIMISSCFNNLSTSAIYYANESFKEMSANNTKSNADWNSVYGTFLNTSIYNRIMALPSKIMDEPTPTVSKQSHDLKKSDFVLGIEKTFSECLDIVVKKDKDYSGEDALSNFNKSLKIGVEPSKAVFLRVEDKMSRLTNILNKGVTHVSDETINDTINDMINYLAIMKSIINNK